MIFVRGLIMLTMSIGIGSGSSPDPGIWTQTLSSNTGYGGVAKNMFAGTKMFVTINCSPSGSAPDAKVKIGWILKETRCWNEFELIGREEDKVLPAYYNNPGLHLKLGERKSKKNGTTRDSVISYAKFEESKYQCNEIINFKRSEVLSLSPDESKKKQNDSMQVSESGPITRSPVLKIDHDGVYLFVIHVEGTKGGDFQAEVNLEFISPYGYLSAADWPLMPFYGVMCIIYILMGIGWLVVCSLHWKDLLRIQFWIGGVIFLGMLEKAMFYAEFQTINSIGKSTKGLLLSAEIVSCTKRTLARMLVIIVSLGYGIVKPRLGPMLHRVLGIGGLYLVMASTEAYLRIIKPKNDVSTTTMMASIPLALIDSIICWWVFSGLIQTVRTLRLRRNIVKLSLYRHFTNVLIFSVAASIIFMLVTIKFFKLDECLEDWKALWIDEAFWHLLFSILLMCIMILWTPSKNNQRYAFTPLLDYEEDDDSDNDEGFFTDAYDGMKQRLHVMEKSDEVSKRDGVNPEEDPLKWVEENIPETAETENPLPVIDSDEEIETTRFEISKMQ